MEEVKSRDKIWETLAISSGLTDQDLCKIQKENSRRLWMVEASKHENFSKIEAKKEEGLKTVFTNNLAKKNIENYTKNLHLKGCAERLVKGIATIELVVPVDERHIAMKRGALEGANGVLYAPTKQVFKDCSQWWPLFKEDYEVIDSYL